VSAGARVLLHSLTLLDASNGASSAGATIFIESGSVGYVLPAPDGCWVLGRGTDTEPAMLATGPTNGEFPYRCAPGLLSSTGADTNSQNGPQCSGFCIWALLPPRRFRAARLQPWPVLPLGQPTRKAVSTRHLQRRQQCCKRGHMFRVPCRCILFHRLDRLQTMRAWLFRSCKRAPFRVRAVCGGGASTKRRVVRPRATFAPPASTALLDLPHQCRAPVAPRPTLLAPLAGLCAHPSLRAPGRHSAVLCPKSARPTGFTVQVQRPTASLAARDQSSFRTAAPQR
jgi:hypothetical protein